jgi:hypothetical protein
MADQLVYDLSSQTEGSPTVFIKRDWLSILDNQNGQYSGNQCVIDTSQLSNSNRFMSYREAYLQIPMIMTLTGDVPNLTFAPATAATSCDYACGLKNWFGSIIHSIQVDWNGVTVIQQTNYQGLYNSFRLMTSLSVNDLVTQGAAMGFFPDDALSVIFTTAASINGIGTCFTQNGTPSTVVTGAFNSYVTGNSGMIKRQQYINFSPGNSAGGGAAGLTAPTADSWSTLISEANTAQIYKSHIFSKINDGAATRGVVQWAINGVVKLRHLHHMFEKIPLLKGTFLKITMQLNNSVVSFASSAVGANLSVTNVQVGSGGVSPLQIASAAAGNGSVAAFPVGNYTLSLAVGALVLTTQNSFVSSSPMARNITLNVPSYVFAPAYEMAYIGSPIKKLVYEDLYQYQVLNVAAAGTFNNLITNGLANITKVLVLPYFTAAANSGISPLTSPFDGAGCGVTSPLCLLSQFQVVVSGANALYNTQRYAYQEFMEQLSGCNAINGDETDGLTSGLIGQLDFETAYNYYFVNVSRCLDVEKAVPKSVSIQGQNMSGKAIDLIVFLTYEQTISVDVLSGSRV